MNTLDAHCGETVTCEERNVYRRMSSLTCAADFLSSPESMHFETDDWQIRDSVLPPSNPSLDSSEPPKPKYASPNKPQRQLTALRMPHREKSQVAVNPSPPPGINSSLPSQPRRRGTTKLRKQLLTITDADNEGESQEDCDSINASLDPPAGSLVVTTGGIVNPRLSAPCQPLRQQTTRFGKDLLIAMNEDNDNEECESQPRRSSAPCQPLRQQTTRFGKDLLIAMNEDNDNEECECPSKTEDFRALPRMPHREKSQVVLNPSPPPGINSALPSQRRRRGTTKSRKEFLKITEVVNESDGKKDCDSINASVDPSAGSLVVTTGGIVNPRSSAPCQPLRQQTTRFGKELSIITSGDNTDKQFEYSCPPICSTSGVSREYIAKAG